MQFNHAQAARLSPAELAHYAGLGMVPDSSLADRLLDISEAAHLDAERGAGTALAEAYDEGARDERRKAAAVIRKLLQDVAAMVPESDRDGIHARAVADANDYLDESET